MSSIREQILERVFTLLAGATPAGGNVFRSREVSITRAVTPSIVLMPQTDPVERMGQFTDHHRLEFSLEIFVRGDPWDQLADPVWVAAHALLMSDAILGTLVADIRHLGCEFEGQEADRTAGTLTASYQAIYLTNAADVSVGPKP